MSQLYEYVLSLKLEHEQKVGTLKTAVQGLGKEFNSLAESRKKAEVTMQSLGNSEMALRQRADVLRRERSLIDGKDIQMIQRYNREIKDLDRSIHKLTTAGTVSQWDRFKTGINQIPGVGGALSLATNPYAIGGALAYQLSTSMVGNGMEFRSGLAKANTTAMLDDVGIERLGGRLLSMGDRMGSLSKSLPDSFEKVNSQLNNVEASLGLLEPSIKMAQAGFTNVNMTSQGLARAYSATGGTVSAGILADEIMMAKRQGAGELSDFNTYLPGLMASGKSAGVRRQETIGLYSYLTGMGYSPEVAANRQQNLYTALSRPEVLKGMSQYGISTTRNGSTLPLKDILGQVDRVLKSAGGDEERKRALYGMGFTDAQAREALEMSITNLQRFAETVNQVRNSMGELDRQAEKARNPQGEWERFGNHASNAMTQAGAGLAGMLNLRELNDQFELNPYRDRAYRQLEMEKEVSGKSYSAWDIEERAKVYKAAEEEGNKYRAAEERKKADKAEDELAKVKAEEQNRIKSRPKSLSELQTDREKENHLFQEAHSYADRKKSGEKIKALDEQIRKMMGMAGQAKSDAHHVIEGQRPQNFYITVQKLEGIHNLTVAKLDEGVDQAGDKVLEEMLRVFNGVEGLGDD